MSTDLPIRPHREAELTARQSRRTDVRELLRRRRLAGHQRVGTWARAQARQACWDFVTTNWRLLIAMVGVAAPVIGVVSWLMPDPFTSGLVLGVGGTLTLGGVALVVVDATGISQLSTACWPSN